MLRADLVDFIESGVSLLVGTRDAAMRPETTRAMGARVDPVTRNVTVYPPVATSQGTIANLRAIGRVAMTFCRPMDHRTYQVKGDVVA